MTPFGLNPKEIKRIITAEMLVRNIDKKIIIMAVDKLSPQKPRYETTKVITHMYKINPSARNRKLGEILSLRNIRYRKANPTVIICIMENNMSFWISIPLRAEK